MARAFFFLTLVTASVSFAPFTAAQPSPKVARIGYLSPLDPARETSRAEAIRQALRQFGYIEGQNITVDYRYTLGKLESAPELAAELVRLKVDVIIVGGGSGPVHAAKNATTTIPIVMMALAADPVDAGLVKSLARPGGNVTGITSLSRELGGKRLELFKEAIPKLARITVMYDPAIPQSSVELKEVLPVAGRALRLSLQPRQIHSAGDFEKIFAALGKERADGLYMTSGGLMNSNQQHIAALALKSRLPSMFSRSEAVDAGGLIFYGADLNDSYRRVAYYVDRILKGTKPADLPVEQPKKFELVINLDTAKKIGVTIAPNLLARADRVIQ